MCEKKFLIPNINDGRFFISPILGCSGGCSYCYLKIKEYDVPRKNELSTKDFLTLAKQCSDFKFGIEGTIISIGAWGDIFPLNNSTLVQHSVDVIKDLLSWGNPVQIMSKNSLDKRLVRDISQEVRYPGQLLYSTTITTIDRWEHIEPGTVSPLGRLNTAGLFHEVGVPTNVLIKPFMPKITGQEITRIADLLLLHKIDYCTLGVMYWSPEISRKIEKISVLNEIADIDSFSLENHLDCNGESPIVSNSVGDLIPYIEYLRKRGIATFLKSSCVISNALHVFNASNYYGNNNA